MAATYTHDYAAFGTEVLAAGFMVKDMHARAERIMAAAIAMSPHETGNYASSFVVESGVRTRVTARAFGRVTNTSGHAAAVEFGFGNTPRYRILGKAMAAGG